MTITRNPGDGPAETPTAPVEFGRSQCVLRIGRSSVRASWRAVLVVAALLLATLAALQAARAAWRRLRQILTDQVSAP